MFSRLAPAPESTTGEITRQRLLQAAFDVFASRGFDAGTVREITDRADANLAAVSYHFRGKEELYVAVIAQAVLRLLTPVARALATVAPPAAPSAALSEVLPDLLFDAQGASPAVQLVARDLAGGGRALRHVIRLAMQDHGVLGRAIDPWRRHDDTSTLAALAGVLGALTTTASLAPPIREPMRDVQLAALQQDRAIMVQQLASQLLASR